MVDCPCRPFTDPCHHGPRHFQKFELTSPPRRRLGHPSRRTFYTAPRNSVSDGSRRGAAWGAPSSAGIIGPWHSNVATPRFHRARVDALPTAGLRLFVSSDPVAACTCLHHLLLQTCSARGGTRCRRAVEGRIIHRRPCCVSMHVDERYPGTLTSHSTPTHPAPLLSPPSLLHAASFPRPLSGPMGCQAHTRREGCTSVGFL